MEYDHEGQKTSKSSLEQENPIICHAVEEGEDNKKIKLFFSVPVHLRNWIKAEKGTKYEAESKKEAETKEKISSATPEGETLEKYKLGSQ